MKIVKDKKHPGMYRIKWPDGTISVSNSNPEMKDGNYGFYNKIRAKEFLRRLDIEDHVLDQIYNSPVAQLEAR